MKILIIGSGGREHALAWKLQQSERVEQVWVMPGNGGTRSPDLSVPATAYLDAAQTLSADLTVVGPEIPLAEGIVDQFQAAGLSIWGPTQAAAQIEASKAFAKAFMARHQIPSASYETFTDFAAAQAYLQRQREPIVIKASGLAAGKGVMLPDSPAEAEAALKAIMLDQRFGAAGDEVVIEARLEGPELSVLAFCDGQTFRLMPAAQDHKRAFDGDTGPNTGGMGAYAPAPIATPELLAEISRTVFKPTLDGLRSDGLPYIGVLYAGLMLTARGPMVLEFNCRFGDPETQVILPLLESDLLDIIEHSLAGTLADLDIRWRAGAAATVVLASGGYPGSYQTGHRISGLAAATDLAGVTVFQAGTRLTETEQLVTNGGRVLNVTARGDDLSQALGRAYEAVNLIAFEGMQYRTDIGAKAS